MILCLASKKKKVFKRILHGTERHKGFYCAADLGCWVSLRAQTEGLAQSKKDYAQMDPIFVT